MDDTVQQHGVVMFSLSAFFLVTYNKTHLVLNHLCRGMSYWGEGAGRKSHPTLLDDPKVSAPLPLLEWFV